MSGLAPPPTWELPRERSLPAGRGGSEPGHGGAPHVDLEGYAGPVDHLLEMARRRWIDLGPISISAFANQFAAALEASGGAAPLERQGAWVVDASWVVLLKSHLLLPAPEKAEEKEAAEPADDAARRQEREAFLGAAADWLEGLPRLGRDTFGRGTKPKPARPGYAALLEAALVVFRGAGGRPEEQVYRPAPPRLWTVADAVALVQAVLARAPEGGALPLFLPRVPGDAPDRGLRARGAVAGTFVAALELARDGRAALEQEGAFGAIAVRAVQAAAEGHTADALA